MKSVFVFLVVYMGLNLSAEAQQLSFRVLPWNNHRSAVSLTFDDAFPVHFEVAAPEMAKRGLRGTFFLIANKVMQDDSWKKLVDLKQEIGSHTIDHLHAADLTPDEERRQIVDSKKALETRFGVPVTTFAYPYVEVTPGLRKWVDAEHFLARGGEPRMTLRPSVTPDWGNVPSAIVYKSMTAVDYEDLLADTLEQGSWLVFMFHGVEGPSWSYEAIPQAVFFQVLDDLKKQTSEIWTAPFGEVGAYWRAQKAVEQAKNTKEADKTIWRWDPISNLPPGVTLKIRFEGALPRKVFQTGGVLVPDPEGIYNVRFDELSLTVE